ncbi:hypothetical protein, partial [Xanthomonas oryzae]|uniref:hypothetical protein n=1 Tax=Xanthomonas oryzae TaxID=347 RepID=UPI001ED9638A
AGGVDQTFPNGIPAIFLIVAIYFVNYVISFVKNILCYNVTGVSCCLVLSCSCRRSIAIAWGPSS